MKKLLFMLCLGCTVTLSAQESNLQQSIQNSDHKVIGYIKGGVITDANNNFMGDFKPVNGELAVSDKNHNIIGYIIQGTIIKDANHNLLGTLKSDATSMACNILDATQKPIGYINFQTGNIEDPQHKIIGYEVNSEVMWVAPYFFFFKS